MITEVLGYQELCSSEEESEKNDYEAEKDDCDILTRNESRQDGGGQIDDRMESADLIEEDEEDVDDEEEECDHDNDDDEEKGDVVVVGDEMGDKDYDEINTSIHYNVEGINSPDSGHITCTILSCNTRSFPNRSMLLAHLKKSHSVSSHPSEEIAPMKVAQCPECFTFLSDNRSVKKHRRTVHRVPGTPFVTLIFFTSTHV
jgi:hypothetical protein